MLAPIHAVEGICDEFERPLAAPVATADQLWTNMGCASIVWPARLALIAPVNWKPSPGLPHGAGSYDGAAIGESLA